MKKDKMKLEEAVELLQEQIEMLDRHIKNYEESNCKTNIYLQLVKEKQAIETVLQELKIKDNKINKIKRYCKSKSKFNCLGDNLTGKSIRYLYK